MSYRPLLGIFGPLLIRDLPNFAYSLRFEMRRNGKFIP